MSIPFVDLKAQYNSIKPEIDQAISAAIEDTAFIGGQRVRDFETAFSEYIGAAHTVSCANGTDAIEIALLALGIGPGDEVIVPVNSWISTAEVVNTVGAEPVFVDVGEDTFTMNPDLLEAAITEKTKCIIPVHLYGLPANMEAISAVAKKYGLSIIEDSAQAHGAKIDDQTVGSWGDITTFSFYPGKNLGAYGDAGGIVTNDKELAATCQMISNHGQLTKHDHQIIGRNSRLDTIQAAILKVKLKYVEEWTQSRIQVAKWYDEMLGEQVIKPVVPERYQHVFHLYVIRINNRSEVQQALTAPDIGHSIHYPTPLALVPAYGYKKHKETDFPTAVRHASQILSLPIYPELTKEQVSYVCEVINRAAK